MEKDLKGTIAHVDLNEHSVEMETLDTGEYRKYFGGSGLIAKRLLTMMKPRIDPFSPESVFIYACGPMTGGPYSGSGRSAAGCKSPLTGGFGVGEGGGYVGAELRRAGFDAIVVTGVSETPVYLFAHDGKLEIKDASDLWGKTTGEVEELIRHELGDKLVRVAQCGPAAEMRVRYSAVCNDLTHYIGRSGTGAVMGSKNLKAIAARGRSQIPLANRDKVREIASWINKNWKSLSYGLYDTGTAGGVTGLHHSSGLPTRNFRQGMFEGYENITGETMRDTVLIGRDTCYACPIRCKRVVKIDEPYKVDPKYGGPEYETIGSFGSLCGIDDLEAICKANEICNANGIDTISAGVSIAFAMECFENGILTKKDTDGIELRFGNADGMVKTLQKIVKREGIGDVLADGVLRASRQFGQGSEEFAMHVRGQEIPMHEPRLKWGLGVGYAMSTTGADHCHNMHDPGYASEGSSVNQARAMGVGALPIKAQELSPEKVHLLRTVTNLNHFWDCAVMCSFQPYTVQKLVELVTAVTGWETGTAELVTVGERAHVMARLLNIREGMVPKDERLPKRFFTPFDEGPLKGKTFTKEEWNQAKVSYYRQAGWTDEGIPTEESLGRLGLRWAAKYVE